MYYGMRLNGLYFYKEIKRFIYPFITLFSFPRLLLLIELIVGKANMRKGRERMTKKVLLSMIFIGMVLFVLTACSSNEIPNAKSWEIEEFSFVDQEEKSFSKEDLRGKVWVADFIFTSCDDVCLPMTFNMSKLQKMLKDEGIQDVELVSFSVDPEVDQPDVLKTFGDRFDADYTNWHFLTGYKQKEIEQFARENFKTLVLKPENADQVTHGTDFYLVDKNGKIVQYYSGIKEIPFDDIIQHIKILQKG